MSVYKQRGNNEYRRESAESEKVSQQNNIEFNVRGSIPYTDKKTGETKYRTYDVGKVFRQEDGSLTLSLVSATLFGICQSNLASNDRPEITCFLNKPEPKTDYR
jgi:hypothetical protein